MKTKIILFNPKPTEDSYYKGVPIALLSICRFLAKEKKYDFVIINSDGKYDYCKKILDEARDALCLCITCLTATPIKDALYVAGKVKERYPELPIIFGGWHVTLLPEQSITNKNIDIIIKGHGELTFTEIIKRLEEGKPIDDVQGIAYKKNGKVVSTPDRPLFDFEKLPPLPYELIDVNDYILKTELGERTINLVTSHGCPFNCGFCAEHMMHHRRWYGIPAEKVADEMEFLIKGFNVDSFVINDSNFFVNKHRVEDIAKEILKRGLKIKWGRVNGHVKQLKGFEEELWRILKESGLESILIGAEAGSQEMLEFIQKDATIEDTIKVAVNCDKFDIHLIYSFMIGLPPRNDAEAKNMKKRIKGEFESIIDMINGIINKTKQHAFMLFFYIPFPGSPMYEMSKKFGFKEPKNIEEWSDIGLYELSTPWVPKKYQSIMDQMRTSILPFVSDYRNQSEDITKSMSFRIIKAIAMFRLRHKFFYFPLEYYLMKIRRKFVYKKKVNYIL